MLGAFVLSCKKERKKKTLQHRFKIQIGNVKQRRVHDKSNAKNKTGRRAAPKRCLLNRSPVYSQGGHAAQNPSSSQRLETVDVLQTWKIEQDAEGYFMYSNLK